MNITVQIDSVGFKNKPKGADIAAIKPRMAASAPVTLSLEDFAEKVTAGHSFSPGILEGGAKAENWKCQQIFGLDIDNEDKSVKGKHNKERAKEPLTVDNVLERCQSMEIAPALIYETFSSTPEWQKFRIVFVNESVISDWEKVEYIQYGLMELFPECDRSCKNADRLFFGGKRILHKSETVLTGKCLKTLESFGAFCRYTENNPNRGSGGDKRLEELKRDFDFLGYIRSFSDKERRVGDRILFNPCPICGHKDDFWFWPATNSFKCFGASGDCGGSVIDFIMHREHLDRKAAIDYFKFNLCGLSRAEEKAAYREKKMIERHNIAAPMSEQVSELPPYIKTKTNERTGEVTYYVQCPALADHFREHNHYFWIKSIGGTKPLRYLYRGGVYSIVSDEEIKGILRDYITLYDPAILKMRDVEETFKILCCDNAFHSADELNADETVINFQNGILHLDTGELTEHSPELLSTIQIHTEWDPLASSTPMFDRFMKTLTAGNSDVIRLLLEFMGLAISNIDGSRPKKALFLVGKGHTGKSRPRILLERLLGAEYCSPCNISDMEERFGTSSLYGKRLVGAPDMSAMNVRELKIFKSITGGDSIPIEFKGMNSFQYSYKGVLWFGANEMPKFGGDKGDHVYDRMIIVRCDNVIPENERDSTIVDKMFAERRGIIVLLVNALRRFISRGYKFDIPDVCKLETERYKAENSSVLTFYNECCCERITAKDNCTTKKLYDIFKAWAKANGEFVPSKQNFWKELSDHFAGGDKKKLIKKSGNEYYPLFTVTLETKDRYREAYGIDHI